MPFSGIACNSWTRASIRFCTFPGWCDRCRIRLERMPQVCSVGLMSGDQAGQFVILIHVSSMKVMDTWAVWARGLSFIKMNSACMWPDNRLQNITTMSCCHYTTTRKHIQVCMTIQGYVGPDHDEPPLLRSTSTMLVCVTFSLTSPHPSTSIISWFSETALICEGYWPPMTNPPVLMLASKVESHCTVLRSENWALGRSSGSHTIIMEFIRNNLVGQVNFSSTTEVNFQRFGCTRVIATRQQDETTVLQWSCPGTTLPLSPGVLSTLQTPGNFSIVGRLRSGANKIS